MRLACEYVFYTTIFSDELLGCHQLRLLRSYYDRMYIFLQHQQQQIVEARRWQLAATMNYLYTYSMAKWLSQARIHYYWLWGMRNELMLMADVKLVAFFFLLLTSFHSQIFSLCSAHITTHFTLYCSWFRTLKNKIILITERFFTSSRDSSASRVFHVH